MQLQYALFSARLERFPVICRVDVPIIIITGNKTDRKIGNCERVARAKARETAEINNANYLK